MSNTKRIILISSIAVVVIGLLFMNVAVSATPNLGGGCISVTFDKFLMQLVDRAVLRDGNDSYEITDADLIEQIKSETLCATKTDLCHSETTDRWIELYIGDMLVRQMRWEDEHDQIIVYQADLFHWIIYSLDGDGMVQPSADLTAKLYEILEA